MLRGAGSSGSTPAKWGIRKSQLTGDFIGEMGKTGDFSGMLFLPGSADSKQNGAACDKKVVVGAHGKKVPPTAKKRDKRRVRSSQSMPVHDQRLE